MDLDHGRVGAGRGGRQWRKAARCTQRHMGGCARCPGSGEPPPAAHDGANDSPAPATPGCFGDQTGSGSGAPALACLALPSWNVRSLVRPPRPAGRRRRPRRSCTPERRPGGGRRNLLRVRMRSWPAPAGRRSRRARARSIELHAQGQGLRRSVASPAALYCTPAVGRKTECVR